MVTARTVGTQVPNGAKAQHINTFSDPDFFPGGGGKANLIACLFDRTRGLLPVAVENPTVARYTIDSIGCTSAPVFFFSNGANSRPYLGGLVNGLIFYSFLQ